MTHQTFTIGSRFYTYSYIQEIRKTLRLSVMPSGEIVLKCPVNYPNLKRDKFLKRKWQWLDKQLQFFNSTPKSCPIQSYVSGSNFQYLGKNYMIQLVQTNEDDVTFSKSQLIIHTTKNFRDIDHNKGLLDAWLKVKTEQVFHKRYRQMSKSIGIKNPPTLRIKYMHKRWGSFLSGGSITLNPNLITKPIKCIDYVITHELCHLTHSDHNKKFYDLLEVYLPKWKEIKLSLELNS
jgi:predicted metal-dependent hydrolase